MHFDVPRDFFDLVMKESLSSASRAKAFLWLMWWYLESDFSREAALKNPYGPGRAGKDAPADEMPVKCPQFEFLTDEQAALENVDTQFEKEFGEIKRQERISIINGEFQTYQSSLKRGRRSMSHGFLSVRANHSR
jgi:Ino eighty subunit 1